MDKLGKLTFRFATNNDKHLVEDFCKLQKDNNNTSLETMKWDWRPVWTIALHENKIVSIAGAHELPEVSPNAYRCLFRGAQLPGYTLMFSKNIFKTGIQLSYLLPLQMKWAKMQNEQAEFYLSSNVNNEGGGKSHRWNKVLTKTLVLRNVLTLEKTIKLYNVQQYLWKINTINYFKERSLSINIS